MQILFVFKKLNVIKRKQLKLILEGYLHIGIVQGVMGMEEF